ncbi:mucin-2-like [Dunckerocampus dactyliophorus]|uniref:mucin-2-like n=1 Tax=Dunckerocampus dactyliophorus TaxID=161453 RepID=UPI00240680EB|nr:mucin-2-like [Dunckerocampus dactyliophorus]
MEAKIYICLGALLVFHLGAAEHGVEHAAHTTPQPDLDHHTSPPNTIFETSSTSSTGRSLNITTHLETSTVTAQPNKDNDTNMEVTSVVSNPEKRGNFTDDTTSNPSVPVVLTSIAPNTSRSIPAHTAHTDAPTSAHSQPSDLLPVSTEPSSQTTSNSQTHSPTSAAMTTYSTTAATTQSTASTGSTRETPTSPPLLQTSLGPHPEASSEAHLQTTTIAPPQLTATQARLHSGTPSPLNVKGDAVMVPDSPTLDPLLAGLVSAFIITAAIITLLLFLKLRRRDNRPEFRRLQDLPMDDMMEETPLSMYSY